MKSEISYLKSKVKQLEATVGVADHGALTGLSDHDHPQYVRTTTDETVAGVKTFSSSPIVPAPTTNFQAATKKYVDDNAGGGVGSVLFDATKLQNLNCGCFWRPSASYSHFFWEAWVKPTLKSSGDGSWTGYFVSDNHGGNHNLLWGCTMAGTGNYVITGNIWNGASTENFTTVETLPANHWTLLAVGWDGSHIMLWVDGLLRHIQAYSGTRSQPGGNNFTLHIGGSDHNNYNGYVAQIRGYEGYGRCREISDYTPERYFRPMGANSSAIRDLPQFQLNLMTNQTIYQDISAGFEGMLHPGVPNAQLSVQNGGLSSPSYNDFEVPQFVAGDISYGTYVPSAPATPSGALVWDSFSRANSTWLNKDMLLPSDSNPTLGSTEAGSLGVLAWESNSGVFPDSCGQILNGKAVVNYQGAHSLLSTGVTDVDIRVNRNGASFCYTSIMLRYKDDDNYTAFWGNDSGITMRERVAGVNTDTAISVSAGWVTMRAVANGTALTVYTGTATEGTFTSVHTDTIANDPAATKHGLFNCQFNTKTVYSADNFLIKAA